MPSDEPYTHIRESLYGEWAELFIHIAAPDDESASSMQPGIRSAPVREQAEAEVAEAA